MPVGPGPAAKPVIKQARIGGHEVDPLGVGYKNVVVSGSPGGKIVSPHARNRAKGEEFYEELEAAAEHLKLEGRN